MPMRCSECSEIVKPVVAIDIDGTLGDYHGHFLRFAASYLGLDETEQMLRASLGPYGGDFPFSTYVSDLFGINKSVYRDIKLAYRQGGMKRTMPIRAGATALCKAVRDEGAELWMTTTRPYLSLDNVVPDTTFWLNHHEIAFDYMLFDEDKYEQLVERVDPARIVAVLDDLPEMYDAVHAIFNVTEYAYLPEILVQTKFNRKVQRDRFVADLSQARKVVIERIRYWREDNA